MVPPRTLSASLRGRCRSALGFLSACIFGMVRPLAQAQERDTLQLPENQPVTMIVVSTDDKYLAVITQNYTLRLFDLRTKKEIGALQGDGKVVERAVFSPDGATLATRNKETTVKLWEVPTLKLKRTLGDKKFIIFSLAYSPDGKAIATAGGEKRGGEYIGLIKLWDVKTGAELKTFRGHTWPPSCLAFSKDSQTLVSGAYDGAVKVWDVKTGKEKASFEVHRGPLHSLDLSRDGKLVAAGGEGGVIALIDLKAGEVKKRLTSRFRGDIKCVRFSPDGKLLASGGGHDLLVWDVASGKLAAALEGHKGPIESLAFTSKGDTILTAAFDHTVKFWDTPEPDDE